MIDFEPIITNVQRYILLFPLIVAAVKYKIFFSELKKISWYIVLSVAVHIATVWLALLGKNNLFLVHIYVVGSFILLARYYGAILTELIHNKWIITIMVVFTILAILNARYLQPLDTLPTYTLLLSSVIILTFIFLSIYERHNRLMPKKFINGLHYARNRVPYFFINTGLIIFHAASVPILICVDLALKEQLPTHTILRYWTIYRCLIIILNVFLGIGLLKYKRRNMYTSSGDSLYGISVYNPIKPTDDDDDDDESE